MPFRYIPDKCNPPTVDMGKAIVFADAMPGMNDTVVRPFGWTEYESAYRHQYVPDPCPARRPCVDKCKPKGTSRKPNPKEFVDPSKRVPRRGICNICRAAKCCCPIPPPWEECREKVMVYDPDIVRTLLVHGEVKNEHPFVLSCCDYQNVAAAADAKSKEEKAKECEEQMQARLCAREECHARAEELRLIDKYRLNDSISPQAREDMEEIICRAQAILKDDEPEVRTINKVVLAAKVQAIREAQLAEKELIKCEQAEEERRILAVIEQDKAHALIPDDHEEIELIEAKKKRLMEAILAQLQEKEAMKYYEKEQIECEREAMRKAWEEVDLKEMRERMMLEEKKHKLGIELLRDQMSHLEMEKHRKEFDRLEDQKLLEWQKKKAEEEERMENERKAQKKLKELAIKQVLDTQKRTTDDKALRDELRAKRHIEEQEREWRRKERESILKKQQNTQSLKEAILSQIERKQQFMCEQAAFEKASYDKMFDVQDDSMEQERLKEEERQLKNAQYRYDLREQIHNYQLDKVQERKIHFIEGINMRREMARRDAEIRCTMERKLDELRDSNLPDKYINYIRRAVDEELKPEWQKSMSKK